MREHYNKGWQEYVKCNTCWEFKPATKDFWYKSSTWYLWLSSYCKDCDKVYGRKRRSNPENKEKMRQKNRERKKTDRYKKYRKEYDRKVADTERGEKYREYKREYSKMYREKNKEKIMQQYKLRWDKVRVDWRARKWIKKLWIRPSSCPICWKADKIVAHHPDYNKREEVIFCCECCHQRIHAWWFSPEIEITNIKDIIYERWRFDWCGNNSKTMFERAN